MGKVRGGSRIRRDSTCIGSRKRERRRGRRRERGEGGCLLRDLSDVGIGVGFRFG